MFNMIRLYKDLRDCKFSRLRALQLIRRGEAEELMAWYRASRMGKWYHV